MIVYQFHVIFRSFLKKYLIIIIIIKFIIIIIIIIIIIATRVTSCLLACSSITDGVSNTAR